MIKIDDLTDEDIGRHVSWRDKEFGVLSSWNSRYVFVRFNGPNGEACRPAEVSFTDEKVVRSEREILLRIDKLFNTLFCCIFGYTICLFIMIVVSTIFIRANIQDLENLINDNKGGVATRVLH